jgi:hypothetical protein
MDQDCSLLDKGRTGSMKSKVAPQISDLSAQLERIRSWVITTYGSTQNVNFSLVEYPDWNELRTAFVDAVHCKPIDLWTKRECSIFREAITMDWQRHLLLDGVSSSELIEMAIKTYPDKVITMYFLVGVRVLSDVPSLQRVALYHFDVSPDDAVREEAFQMLARCKWSQTEKQALLFWKSGKVSEQIVALNALAAYESEQLDRYLDLAESTNDPSLMRIARATRTLEALKKADARH